MRLWVTVSQRQTQPAPSPRVRSPPQPQLNALSLCAQGGQWVRSCWHWQGGICVYVCSYIVHLLSGLLNDIKTGSGMFWKWNRTVGLTSSERGTYVELLERGHLFPICIFLFFYHRCWSVLFPVSVHIGQVHFSCKNRRGVLLSKGHSHSWNSSHYWLLSVGGIWEAMR